MLLTPRRRARSERGARRDRGVPGAAQATREGWPRRGDPRAQPSLRRSPCKSTPSERKRFRGKSNAGSVGGRLTPPRASPVREKRGQGRESRSPSPRSGGALGWGVTPPSPIDLYSRPPSGRGAPGHTRTISRVPSIVPRYRPPSSLRGFHPSRPGRGAERYCTRVPNRFGGLCMTPKEVMDLIKGKNIEIVDLKFQDFPGTWQHFSIPISEVTPTSSTRGWASTAPASADGRPFTRAT